jgi:uncharacterized protein YceH (UPF0502 family)
LNSELDNATPSPANLDRQGILDPFEIRVLGVLAEKEALTPENYPMSLNAITNGCNQLSSRDPVLAITEPTVQDVLQRLLQKKFVAEVTQAGARVVKYEHRMRIKWSLQQDKLTVLTLLMLRGMQTAGEVRTRSGRMHEFSSVAEAEASLQFLIDKFPPLVARLTRTPGTKEPRYAHLLTGEEVSERQEIATAFSSSLAIESSRQDRLVRLEEEVAHMRREFDSLTQQFENFKKLFD